MATYRFYYSSTTAADVSPAFDSDWGETASAVRRKLKTTPAGTGSSGAVGAAETSATQIDVLNGQFISDSDVLPAGPIAGTFDHVISCRASGSGAADMFQQIRIHVFDSTGATKRGTLYDGLTQTSVSATNSDPNGEFAFSAQDTRILDNVAIVAGTTAQAGDRLVVEFGARACNTSTTSRTSTIDFRDDTVADHALTAGLTANGRPWLELDLDDDVMVAPSAATATAQGEVPTVGATEQNISAPAATATAQGEAPSVSDEDHPSIAPTPGQSVPLTVRIGNKHITREVSALQIRREAIGGVKSISLRLARPLDRFDPDLAALSAVYVYDGRTAETIAEGRLTDFGRSASAGDGQQWDMVAFGPGQHASDEPLPLVYFDSGTDKWRRSTYNTGSTQTVYDEIDENTPGCMMRPTEGATVTTSWLADMVHRAVRRSGMDLGRIKCTWDSGVTDSNFVVQLVTRDGTGGGTTAASASANTAGGTLSAVVATDFTQGHDVVSVRVVRNTSSTTATENDFFHFYNFAIRALIYNANGTVRTTGYSNDYLLAHEVVNDLLGRGGLDQYDGTNAAVDTGGTYQIDQMAYPDGATAEQVLTDLMTLEPAYRWWAGPDVTGSGYEFHWEPWPTTVRYEVTLNDGGDFPASWQEVYNKVTVRWTDKNGLSRTNTRTSTIAEFDAASPPITRSTVIDLADEIGSTAAADRAGDNFLAEHNVPANAGTVTVARPIRDLITGRMVHQSRILEGELIRVRGIESYPDALNASSNDGLTVFRIWSATYNSDSDSAALELDTWSRSTANALARLAKRRNRKR